MCATPTGHSIVSSSPSMAINPALQPDTAFTVGNILVDDECEDVIAGNFYLLPNSAVDQVVWIDLGEVVPVSGFQFKGVKNYGDRYVVVESFETECGWIRRDNHLLWPWIWHLPAFRVVGDLYSVYIRQYT